MSDLLVDIGTALTGVLSWFTSALAVIETALASSVLLQIILAVAAVSIGFAIIKKVIQTVKAFRAGK